MTTAVQPGFAGEVYPMTHARLCSNPTSLRGTLTASSEAAGYAAANAASPLTYSYWRPATLPATWEIATPEAEWIGYAGIANHNLGSVGATVHLETWDGSAWVEVLAHVPLDDNPIVLLIDPVFTTRARVRITGAAVPTLAVIMFGQPIEMCQPVYSGYTPVDLAPQTEYRVNRSEGGQWLGRSVRYVRQRTEITWTHLPEDWVRDDLAGFLRETRTRPFFVTERPAGYPEAVVYTWTEADLRPMRTGPRNFMSLSI